MDQDLKPLVSVVMPAYNAGPYIKQAIQSVLDQTYTPLELVIVDDGSTDNSLSVMQEFVDDPRVKIIQHTTNAGIIAARQTALDNAKGDYVAVLDADDYWIEPDKIAQQVAFLTQHPDYGLVGTGARLVDESGQSRGRLSVPDSDAGIRRKILFKNCFIHSSIMFRRDLYTQSGGYLKVDRDGIEDYGLTLRLGRLAKMTNLPTPTTAYRINPAGISQRRRRQQIIDSLALIKNYRATYPYYAWGWLKRQAQLLFVS